MHGKLAEESEEIRIEYFEEQEHSSLQLCIKHLREEYVLNSGEGLLMQVSKLYVYIYMVLI